MGSPRHLWGWADLPKQTAEVSYLRHAPWQLEQKAGRPGRCCTDATCPAALPDLRDIVNVSVNRRERWVGLLQDIKPVLFRAAHQDAGRISAVWKPGKFSCSQSFLPDNTAVLMVSVSSALQNNHCFKSSDYYCYIQQKCWLLLL